MISISIVPHEELGTKLQSEIVALCSDAYEEDFEPYFRLLERATHVLAMESDKLVAHGAWVSREVRVGRTCKPLHCAYIEAIATPARLQGRGLGTLVLKSIPPLILDFDIAALSPSEPEFYARSGWEMWQGPLSYTQEGQRIKTPDEQVMIYRLPRTPSDVSLEQELETDWREGDVW